jgi:hypothetical protein
VLNELKNSFFEFTLRFFPENLDAVSEEQGERFHQDIKKMEKDTRVGGMLTLLDATSQNSRNLT